MRLQVAYPTDAEDKIDWPHETTAMDGLIGKDYYTNYMLIERLRMLTYADVWMG